MKNDGLAIPEGFFRSKQVLLLRKRAGEDTYVIIYMKILIINAEQGLKYKGSMDEIAEALAVDIDESFQNIKDTLYLLYKMNIIKPKDLLQIGSAVDG